VIDRAINDPKWLWKCIGIWIALVLVIYGIVHIITYRKVETVRVVAIKWDTAIARLQYQTISESDWYVPTGGRVTDSYSKQRGTRSVPDGEEKYTDSNGNTKYRTKYRRVPVYDTHYEYDIDKWVHIEPLRASGIGYDWYMPDTTDTTYTDGNNPHIGDIHLSTPLTHFYIIYIGDKEYSVDMVESMWKEHELNDYYHLTPDWFGGVKKIEKASSW
jgi:hypothetical protein